jgi:hypothetical protein
VNVDEFAHTNVEQRARHDQQRVLEALARRDQQRALATLQAKEDAPTPVQAPAADDRPTGPRALLMAMGDFCVATSAVTDGVTASLIRQAKIKLTAEVQTPTHPALLSDGGGAAVGGVGDHQTQDIDTEIDNRRKPRCRRRDNHRPTDPECPAAYIQRSMGAAACPGRPSSYATPTANPGRSRRRASGRHSAHPLYTRREQS